MSKQSKKLEELHHLLQQLVDDGPNSELVARIEQLLTDDPEACDAYLDFMGLHSDLQCEFGEAAPLPSVAVEETRGRSQLRGSSFRMGARNFFQYAAVAVVAVALTTVVHLLWSPRGEPTNVVLQAPVQARDYVATVVRLHEVQWNEATDAREEGDRLLPGTLAIVAGLAVLRFDSGANVILQGPAELEIESPGAATLGEGRVTVQAEEEAFGFVLRTPDRDLVDLGTEFHVAVDPEGPTEVHVLDGEVELQPRKRSVERRVQLLTEGEAVRFRNADDSGERLQAAALRYDQLLPQADHAARGSQLLAYEGFQYDVERLPMTKADGGSGWASAWMHCMPWERVNRDSSLRLASDLQSLDAWEIASPVGRKLVFPVGRTWWIRKLETPIDLGVDRLYYISFLLHRGDARRGGNAVSRVLFRSSEGFSSRFGFGVNTDDEPYTFGGGGNAQTQTRLQSGETYFVVGKFVAAAAAPDQMFLTFYRQGDQVDDAEPLKWSVVSRTFDSDAVLDYLVTHGYGVEDHTLDEIRIGTSWESVVPQPAK